jgi:hypothetical protein
MAKKIELTVTFSIKGTVIVNAKTKKEAKKIIERDLGLCLGGNIHTSTNDIDDWKFPIHFDKKITT